MKEAEAEAKAKAELFVPDEIITNILSRLPAKSAMRCRLVCRTWRDLTLSRSFVDSHLKNSIPTVLVTTYSYNTWRHGSDVFALDNWWESDENRLIIQTFPLCFRNLHKEYGLLFSHAGLIVLRESLEYGLSDIGDISESNFIIINPVISREYVKITLPRELNQSTIYGVYSHPLLKEYCSLWKIQDLQSKQIHYKMLTLGSKPSMKTVSNPFNNRVKFWWGNPLYIDNYLYWMLETEQGRKYDGRHDIMEFDVISEEFRVIPCPVPLNTVCFCHQTHLVNNDGILWFVMILSGKISIWRLKDRVKHLWIAEEYTFGFDWVEISAIAMDGKLAILSRGILHVCNLMDETMMSFHKSRYQSILSYLSHRMSLASLKKCKSTIVIDKDGEVVPETNKGFIFEN